MITSLALSLIAIASGTLLTYTYDEGAPLVSRLSSGACIGFAAMALAGFVLALFFGLNPNTIGLTAVLLLLPGLLLKSRSVRNQIDQDINQALKAISRASSKPDPSGKPISRIIKSQSPSFSFRSARRLVSTHDPS